MGVSWGFPDVATLTVHPLDVSVKRQETRYVGWALNVLIYCYSKTGIQFT